MTSVAGYLSAALSVPMAGLGAGLVGARLAGVGPAVQCPMLAMIGRPCPFCGVTRAAEAVLQLEPTAATVWLPASMLVVAIALMTLYVVASWLRRKPLAGIVPRLYLGVFLGLTVANWIWQWRLVAGDAWP